MKINLFSLKNEHIPHALPHFHYILQLNKVGIMMSKDDKKHILIIHHDNVINLEFLYTHYICNITKKQYELLTSNDKITQEMMFKIIINEYKDL